MIFVTIKHLVADHYILFRVHTSSKDLNIRPLSSGVSVLRYCYAPLYRIYQKFTHESVDFRWILSI